MVPDFIGERDINPHGEREITAASVVSLYWYIKTSYC